MGQFSTQTAISQCWHTTGTSIPFSSHLTILIRDLPRSSSPEWVMEQTTSQVLQPVHFPGSMTQLRFPTGLFRFFHLTSRRFLQVRPNQRTSKDYHVFEAFELIVAPEIGLLEIRVDLLGFLEDRKVVPLQPSCRFHDFLEKIAFVHSDQFPLPQHNLPVIMTLSTDRPFSL